MSRLFEKVSSVLSQPLGYLLYQTVVGGIRARNVCITDIVRPTSGLKVLDIGCGPAYTVDYFPEPEYYGFDISPQYIKFASRRFSANGRFYCRLFEEDTLAWLPTVDVVLMMGLIHHLDDREVTDVFRLAQRAMKPGARLFTLDGYYGPDQKWISRLLLDRDRGKFIREPGTYEKLAKRVFPDVKTIIRDDLFHVPYPIAILECRNSGHE
jgi:SAM-dependent methyltransferase